MYSKHNNMRIKDVTVERYPNRQNQLNKYKQRIFIYPHKESLWDDVANRHSRPHMMYKKEILPLLIKKLKSENKKVYKLLKDVKWQWKQKCVCSCGCSPGFIGEPIDNQYFDISVSFKL